MDDGIPDERLKRLLAEIGNDPMAPPESASRDRETGRGSGDSPWCPDVILDPPDRQGTLGRIGDYHIIRKLGWGGFGVVYEAEVADPDAAPERTVFRRIAIKVLRHEFSYETDTRARFIREANCVAHIHHPNLIRVNKVKEQNVKEVAGRPHPRLVIEMELVDGPSLRELLGREAPLTPEEAARLLLQAARGVAALHSHEPGIIHRDIKPENILLSGSAEAKVGDFGLARPLTRGETITGTGQLCGTTRYMAPECFPAPRGSGIPAVSGGMSAVDRRCDVYSLGVVLYEALTGSPPFDGPDHVLIPKILTGDFPPPRAIKPDIPAELEAVCLRAMETCPADRQATYPTAREFAGDLDRFLKREARAMLARPYRWRERVARLWRREKATVVGLALQAGTALLAFVVMLIILVVTLRAILPPNPTPPWLSGPNRDAGFYLYIVVVAVIAVVASLRLVVECWKGMGETLDAIMRRALYSRTRNRSFAVRGSAEQSDWHPKAQPPAIEKRVWWRSTSAFWFALLGASATAFLLPFAFRLGPLLIDRLAEQTATRLIGERLGKPFQPQFRRDIEGVPRLDEELSRSKGVSSLDRLLAEIDSGIYELTPKQKSVYLARINGIKEELRLRAEEPSDRRHRLLAGFFRKQVGPDAVRALIIRRLEDPQVTGLLLSWPVYDTQATKFVEAIRHVLDALIRGDADVQLAAAEELSSVTTPWLAENNEAAKGLAEPLGKVLSNPQENGYVRFTALEYLKHMSTEALAADAALEGVLRDSGRDIRFEAAKAVWDRGEDNPRRRKAALAVLRELVAEQGSGFDRVAAAEALWERTPWSPESAAEVGVRAAVDDKTMAPSSRVHAAEILWEMDRRQAPGIVAALREVLDAALREERRQGRGTDRYPRTRDSAVNLLAAIGPPARSAVPELIAFLEAAGARPEVSVVGALGEIGDESAAPALIAVFRKRNQADDHAASRASQLAGRINRLNATSTYILAVRRCRARGALPEIYAVLEDPVLASSAQIQAARALVELGGSEALPTLVKLLKQRGSDERPPIIEAIGMLGPGAAGATQVLLRSLGGDLLERLEAARALGNIGPGAFDAVPHLMLLVDDGSTDVQVAAAVALAKIDPSQAQSAAAVLRQVLANGGAAPSLRAASAKALAEIDPKFAPEAVAELGKLLQRGERSTVSAALQALDDLGPMSKDAVPVIVANLPKLYYDRVVALRAHRLRDLDALRLRPTAMDDNLYLRATHILGTIGQGAKAAVPDLETATYSPYAEIREVAGDALRRIDPSSASRSADVSRPR